MTVPLMPETDIGRASHYDRTDRRPAHNPTPCTGLRPCRHCRFCAPSARLDLVVISGDIADSALPEEYAQQQSCLVLCRCHSWQFLAITIAVHLSAKLFPIPPMERQTVLSIRCVASTDSIFC